MVGVISQKVWPAPSLPCRAPGCVSCLVVVLFLHHSFTRDQWEGDAQRGEQPSSSWTLPWCRGRLMLPKEPAHSHGPGQLQVLCPSASKAKQSEFSTSGTCLPYPSCSSSLPEAEQWPKSMKLGKGAACMHQAAQPGCLMDKHPCGFLTTMHSLI